MVPRDCCFQGFQFLPRNHPIRRQLNSPAIRLARLFQSTIAFIEMAELKGQIGVCRRQPQSFGLMQLGLRALARFLMHMPALDMDRRVRRIQPQRFFVQGCSVTETSFISRGVGA